LQEGDTIYLNLSDEGEDEQKLEVKIEKPEKQEG
jgi:hypothetical protein